MDDADLNAVAADAAVFLKGSGLPTDINGDGKVDALDRTLTTTQKNAKKKLNPSYPVNG